MNKKNFIKKYLNLYINYIENYSDYDKLIKAAEKIEKTSAKGNKVIFAGNGASAAISSHAALDFKKQANINTRSFNDPALLTAFSNDFGYENWLKKAIQFYCDKGDIAVLISSSGSSQNIVNAAKYSVDNSIFVITFSGFENENLLKKQGDVNFWVKSKEYNIIENIHQIWLMSICDIIIGKSEYSVS